MLVVCDFLIGSLSDYKWYAVSLLRYPRQHYVALHNKERLARGLAYYLICGVHHLHAQGQPKPKLTLYKKNLTSP